ncbi:hypothetical protein BC938DRAFT_479551 [Jimgerdemannia flammicorona]|uniref:Uncharacterized protein n=1 Tax=Jimgerdemannia flammicorona TaxID=994334 RepID=A0A433QKN8_9FUNG|nr:hypothetical protein BC938DRAFT_479551 [Jimgerdemannia flammicorona]
MLPKLGHAVSGLYAAIGQLPVVYRACQILYCGTGGRRMPMNSCGTFWTPTGGRGKTTDDAPPLVLAVYLKRFEVGGYCQFEMGGGRVDKYIEFLERLDLRGYVSRGQESSVGLYRLLSLFYQGYEQRWYSMNDTSVVLLSFVELRCLCQLDGLSIRMFAFSILGSNIELDLFSELAA